MNVNYVSYGGGTLQVPGMNQPSPEEAERQLTTRKDVLSKYKYIALITTATAVVSITVGIIIRNQADDAGFPLNSGAPIWSAALMLIGAGFGLALGFQSPEWKSESERSKQRCCVMIYYVMSVISFSFIGISTGYSGASLIACAQKDEENQTCNDNFNTLIALNAVTVVTGLILFACSLAVTIMFCCYRRAFQFRSRGERAGQFHSVILQQQQQIATLQATQGNPHLQQTQGNPHLQQTQGNPHLQQTTQFTTGYRPEQYSQFGNGFVHPNSQPGTGYNVGVQSYPPSYETSMSTTK